MIQANRLWRFVSLFLCAALCRACEAIVGNELRERRERLSRPCKPSGG
jgi:hypothetical protein